MSFSDRLKELRIEKGMTQKEMAEQVHISASAVSHFENGTNLPKTSVAIRIMCALECDANYLYQDYIIQDMFQDVSFEERELLEKYRYISAHSKELVCKVLNHEYQAAVERCKREGRIPFTVYIPVQKGNQYILSKGYKKNVWVYAAPLNARADYGILMQSNHLAPTFCDGEIVLVEKQKVRHNEVGLYEIDGHLRIMKLYRNQGTTKLFALNLEDEAVKITSDLNFRCLGRIIGKLEGDYMEKINQNL